MTGIRSVHAIHSGEKNIPGLVDCQSVRRVEQIAELFEQLRTIFLFTFCPWFFTCMNLCYREH